MLSALSVNFLGEAYIFLRLDLPQLKLECLNCQIALAPVFYLGQVFVFYK